MHIIIIANGFQVDYMLNILNGLAGKVEKIDFIGSSIYPAGKIDSRIQMHSLRAVHDEKVDFLMKSYRMVVYYFKLVFFLVKSPAKIVHIQWLRFNMSEGIFFTLLIKALGKKVVYTAHDVLPHSRDNAYNRILFRVIYKLQDRLIVHSDFIKRRIENEFRINADKIFMVKHGLYHITESSQVSRETARDKFGLEVHQSVILFFGIITRYKGLGLLLDAFSKLENDFPGLRLIIAGRVSQEYGPEFKNLIESCPSQKITVLARHISDEEVELLFKASDVTILPYTEASQSGVLFMSYAYGKPVIAPSLGGFPSDIETGKTGYLFEPFSRESLAATIRMFLLSWKSDSSYIRQYAQTNYSWDASADALAKIYDQALNDADHG
jgi:glycosyltransferase involved in cell wall biosynthesis